jgi:NADP-dependent 3-hydroxy acid dehydrogenase YdfG
MAPFAKRTILVTGAAGGIGEAVVRALGARGATVCLLGRNQTNLAEVARRVPEKRGRCYPVELTGNEKLQSVVSRILAENKQIDALVHCAAIFAMGPLATASTADFLRQFKTNVLGPFQLTQLLLPALTSSQGQVVFMNSSVGLKSRAGISQYAATKHALKAVADSLRDECNASGVRVCSLYLGATATPMQAAISAKQVREYRPQSLLQPDDVASLITSVLSLPRTAEVTDIMVRPMVKT